MDISDSLPVKLPIKILFPENFIAPKVAPENFRGGSWGDFLTFEVHKYSRLPKIDTPKIDTFYGISRNFEKN